MKQPDMIFDSVFLSPKLGIYIWRRDQVYLYIGISADVFRRIVSHNIIGKEEPFQKTDTVEVYAYPSDTEWSIIEQDEAALIRQHQPLYNTAYTTKNKRGYGEKRKDKQKAWDKAHPRVKQAVA